MSKGSLSGRGQVLSEARGPTAEEDDDNETKLRKSGEPDSTQGRTQLNINEGEEDLVNSDMDVNLTATNPATNAKEQTRKTGSRASKSRSIVDNTSTLEVN